MPSEKEVFLQLATGLAHIHEKGLIHRDLKPQNVLIYVDNGEKAQLKWADFGLSKPVNENGSCSMSGINRGTDSWYAPEILQITAGQDEGKLEKKKEKKEKKEKKDKDKDTENSEEKDAKKEKKEKKEKKKDKKEQKSEGVTDVEVTSPRLRATVKSDVFGEGLIFGYFLLDGVHPYGSKSHITSNILNDKPVNLKGIYFHFFNQNNRIKQIFILYGHSCRNKKETTHSRHYYGNVEEQSRRANFIVRSRFKNNQHLKNNDKKNLFAKTIENRTIVNFRVLTNINVNLQPLLANQSDCITTFSPLSH